MKSIDDLRLEQELIKLRERYKKEKDPDIRKVIERQAKALKIGAGIE